MSQTIYPALHYRDADAALGFLTDAFGATELAVYRDEEGGAIRHAEVAIEGNLVMFGGTPASASAQATETPAISLYVAVADADAHHRRAIAAGAMVVREPGEMDYGSREYSVRDPEGNLWSFGTYHPDGS